MALAVGTGPDDARAQAPSVMMLRDGQIEKADSEYNTIFVENPKRWLTA